MSKGCLRFGLAKGEERPAEIQADDQSFVLCQLVDQEDLLSGSFHILHMGLILFGGDK